MKQYIGHNGDGSACGDCPVANSRRAFLRHIGGVAAAALGAATLGKSTLAFAESITEIEPLRVSARERSYALPRSDGAFVDVNNDVILARRNSRVYAFSTKCPHKGAQLEWLAGEQRVFCPKHKARFLADGAHVSGRGNRDLDRYGLRRQGETVVVDLSKAYRQDTDRSAWGSAFIALV